MGKLGMGKYTNKAPEYHLNPSRAGFVANLPNMKHERRKINQVLKQSVSKWVKVNMNVRHPK